MGEHIVTSFDEDLAAVRSKISQMGGLAEEMLSAALSSLQSRNTDLAQSIIQLDKRMDALELEVEEMATLLIVQRQPLAQDLRLVISTLKLASTLERIGDLSKSTARRSTQLASTPPAGVTNSIVRMGRQALDQLTAVLDAWGRSDAEDAIAVWRRDVDVDEAYNSLFREVITYMMEDPRTISVGSQLLFIAKNLERIGDHATHVAEMIHYVETGQPLVEDRPKGEPAGHEIG